MQAFNWFESTNKNVFFGFFIKIGVSKNEVFTIIVSKPLLNMLCITLKNG